MTSTLSPELSEPASGAEYSEPGEGDSLNLLLVGSTGNGKSSLGNFLLNPASASDESPFNWLSDPRERPPQSFQTARSNMPETTAVQIARNSSERLPHLLVIDTPGLNETAVKDLSHMIDIVKNVKRLGSVTACILCVKFDSKIDAQYRATIAYYRKLLPSLFEKNVVIVMTNFLSDERTERWRRSQGIDVSAIVRNTVREVMESGELRVTPQVFLIDSVPLDKKDLTKSKKDRKSILNYIQTLDPISIKDMTVAKTAALKNHDEKEIGRLDGKIHGYNMRLQQANEAAADVLHEIERKEGNVTDIKAKIQQTKSELRDKDSLVTVPSQSWNMNNPWQWFQWQTESFSIASPWPVTEFKRWDNGRLEWVDFHVNKEEGVAHGKVQGEWFRGLYASLTLLTEKRVMHKKDIDSLNKALKRHEKSLEESKSALEEYKVKHSKYAKDIELLNVFIKEQNERKEQLMADTMTIDEACQRLEEFNQPTL